jgi:SAM-dependent methyltransferase
VGTSAAASNPRALPAWRRRGRKLVATLRRDGVVEMALFVLRYLERSRERRFGSPFDRKYGCDTSGAIPLDQLEISSPSLADGIQYEGVSALYFRRMLRMVQVSPDDHVFVDLGSGKGRALLMAAEHGFRRIVGVEFSPELHEIAQENVARFRARTGSTQSFELHLGDVASYDFPAEPTLFFLYNPFGEPILGQVLDRLGRSLREVPREVVVFYNTPVHRRLLDEAPFLAPVRIVSQYAVYASRPGGAGARA